MWLSNKILQLGYVQERLKSSLRKFYGRYGDLIRQYDVSLSRMLHDILRDDRIQWQPTSIWHYTNFWTLLPSLTFYPVARCSKGTIATGAACQQRTLTTTGYLVLSPELVLFPDFEFRTSVGTSILLFGPVHFINKPKTSQTLQLNKRALSFNSSLNIYNDIIFPSLNPAKIFQFNSRWTESTKSSAVGPNHMRSD